MSSHHPGRGNLDFLQFYFSLVNISMDRQAKPQCLPQVMQDEIIQRLRRQKMRESVEQFLL